jgi:anti-sigma factor RsiW
MKCKKCQNNIIFFLEGDLPDKEMKQVEHHLAECSNCAALTEELQKTLGVLNEEKSPAVNPFFYTRLKARMESPATVAFQSLKNMFFVRFLQPALFSFLLLAGIYTGIKVGQTSQDTITAASSYHEEQMIPYLNDMETEPIETFLME